MATTVATLTAKLEADTTKLKTGLGQAEKDVKGFGKKSEAAFKKFGKAAAIGAGVAAVAVAGFAVSALKKTAEFEKGMKEVFTLMPGISDKAMGAMEDDVKSLSKEMGVLPNDVVPALYQSLSAGVPPDNVLSFMETASKLAIGGAVELEVAVDGITTAVNAYGEEVLSADEASDIMFTTVKLGKTTVEELSGALFQVAPIAAGLGVNFGEVSAALAALTAQGVPTSVAAVQIKGALAELGKEGSVAFQHFTEATGTTFPKFIEGGGTVEEAFLAMKGKADDMDTGVGNLFGSIEAGQAVLALTGESGAPAFSNAMEEMQGSAGATQEAYETMDESMSRSWDRIKSAVEVAVLDMGAKLQPFVKQFADWFEKQLPKILDTAVEWFGKLVKGVENFVSGAGVIKDWFQDLPEPIGKVVLAIGGVTIALMAMYANPIIAGLGLVAAIVMDIGGNANESRARIDEMRADLETMGAINISTLQDAFDPAVLEAMSEAGLTLREVRIAVTGTDDDMKRFDDRVGKLGKEFVGLHQKENDVRIMTKKMRDEYKKALTPVAELEDGTRDLMRAEGEHEDLLERVGKQARILGEDYATATGDVIAGAEAMGETVPPIFGNMMDIVATWEESIREEVNQVVSGWNELPESMKVGTDAFINNLIVTEAATDEWQENLNALAAAGMDDLVAELESAGIEGRDTVQAFTEDWNAAFEAELRLSGIIGPEIQGVQGILDSLDLSDAEGTMRTLTREMGLTADEAAEVYRQLRILDGTNVRTTVTTTWVNVGGTGQGYDPPGAHGGGVIAGTGTQAVLMQLLPGEGVIDAATMRSGVNVGGGGGGTTIIVEGNLFGAATVDDLVDLIESGRRESQMRQGLLI